MSVPPCVSQASVADRIALFYLRYPTGRLVTELVSDSGDRVLFRAFAYRWSTDRLPAATGWGVETLEKNDRLLSVAFQRAEAAAIARALANLGFSESREIERQSPAGIALPPSVQTHHSSRQDRIINTTEKPEHKLEPAFAASLVMAERYGLSPRRSSVLRAALAGISTADPARQERIARLIRQWITARKLKTLDDRLRRFSR
jgi:hypothetical protein